MYRYLLASSSLIAVALAGSVLPASAQSPSAGAKLWAEGPKHLGPVPYALVEAEAMSEQEESAFRAASRDRLLAETERLQQLRSRAGPSNVTEAESKLAAQDLVDSLGTAYQNRVLDRRMVEDTNIAADVGMVVLQVVSRGKGKGKGKGLAMMEIAAPAIQDSVHKGVENLADVEKNYKASVQTAIDLALAKATPGLVQQWQRQGITEANRAQAAEALFGDANAFFKDGIGKDLDPDVRKELRGVQVDLLTRGLTTVAARVQQGEAALTAFQASTEARFKQQQGQITKVVKDVQALRLAVANQVEAIDLLARTTQSQMERLGSQLEGLSDSNRATQAAMLRQMGPRDRLLALQDPSFLPTKTAEEKQKRDEEVARLARYDRVMTIKEGLDDKLAVVGAAAGFAVRLGIPIDTANLNKNISTAKSAINVVSSLATGNYVGAIMALGGLGGGGGEDGTTAALNAINARLDEVIRLQKETLAKIQELSDKIDRNHEEVMAKLQVIEHKIDNLAQIVTATDVRPYQSCKSFVALARQKGFKITSGSYARYSDRVAHFEADQVTEPEGQSRAEICFRWLRDVVASGEGGPTAVKYEPASAIRSDTWEFKAVGTPASTKFKLEGMWAAHHVMLGWSEVGPKQQYAATRQNCVKRAVSILAGLPSKISGLREEQLSCRDRTDDITTSSEWTPLKLHRGQEMSSVDVTSHPVSVRATTHLAEMMLYLTPFFEIAVRATGDRLRLPQPSELAGAAVLNDKVRIEHTAAGNHMIQEFADQITRTIVQESVLNGTVLVPTIARVLQENQFGAKAAKLTKPSVYAELAAAAQQSESDAARDKLCTVTSKSWKEQPYAVAVCLMQNNPILAQNVGRFIAAKEIYAKAPVTSATLSWAYRATDATLKEMLPGLPTLKRAAADQPTQWQWSYDVPGTGPAVYGFPMVGEVNFGFLDVGPSIERLSDLRDRMEMRAQANAADEHLAKKDNGLSDRRREVARWYLRNGARRETRLIEASLGTW